MDRQHLGGGEGGDGSGRSQIESYSKGGSGKKKLDALIRGGKWKEIELFSER